jgi:BirA family biotin operon repressor/biotin-[acetyl-CoA-carboxylase] ligase
MSILFAIPAHIIAKAPLFTQMLAAAAARSVESNCAGPDVKMKWPNDLIILGRKVGGILAELHPIDSNSNAIIIGIGINLDIPNQIMDAGTSSERRWPAGAIKQLVGVDIDASRLRDTIANDFVREIESFINTGALSASTGDEISRRQLFVGSEIHFNEHGSETISGIHRGLDASTGGIIIELPGGNRRVFHSGELIFRRD